MSGAGTADSPEEQDRAAFSWSRVDRFALESAIADAEGDLLLLNLAVEDILRHQAWSTFRLQTMPGYRLLLLTEGQVRALQHARGRVDDGVTAITAAFYGPDHRVK